MKNIRMMATRIKPMMMVLIRSCRVTRVLRLWSPVIDHFEVGREFGGLHFLDDLFDLVGGVDQVFAGAFDHVQGDDVLAVQAAVAFLVFISPSSPRQYPSGTSWRPDCESTTMFLICSTSYKIAADGDRAGHAADVHVAGRDGHVFAGDGIFDVAESQVGRRSSCICPRLSGPLFPARPTISTRVISFISSIRSLSSSA